MVGREDPTYYGYPCCGYTCCGYTYYGYTCCGYPYYLDGLLLLCRRLGRAGPLAPWHAPPAPHNLHTLHILHALGILRCEGLECVGLHQGGRAAEAHLGRPTAPASAPAAAAAAFLRGCGAGARLLLREGPQGPLAFGPLAVGGLGLAQRGAPLVRQAARRNPWLRLGRSDRHPLAWLVLGCGCG